MLVLIVMQSYMKIYVDPWVVICIIFSRQKKMHPFCFWIQSNLGLRTSFNSTWPPIFSVFYIRKETKLPAASTDNKRSTFAVIVRHKTLVIYSYRNVIICVTLWIFAPSDIKAVEPSSLMFILISPAYIYSSEKYKDGTKPVKERKIL